LPAAISAAGCRASAGGAPELEAQAAVDREQPARHQGHRSQQEQDGAQEGLAAGFLGLRRGLSGALVQQAEEGVDRLHDLGLEAVVVVAVQQLARQLHVRGVPRHEAAAAVVEQALDRVHGDDLGLDRALELFSASLSLANSCSVKPARFSSSDRAWSRRPPRSPGRYARSSAGAASCRCECPGSREIAARTRRRP